MFATVNWLAAAVAALATFVVGGPWYSPVMFGKRWQQEMGAATTSQGGHPAKVFGLSYVFSFVAAACLSALLSLDATALQGLQLGALVGICFVAMSFGVNYQFANRSFTVLLIDGGYHIVQFAVFGLVLGAWPG